MDRNKHGSQSIWQKIEHPLFPSLNAHHHCDVCIIGAGIAGLSTAYRLLEAGKSVVVLDRESIGQGETGLTSAHLASALDDGFARLKRLHGKKGLSLAIESHAAAIDEIERIVKKEKIDCSFERVKGYLFLGADSSRQELISEYELTKETPLSDAELIENAPGEIFETGICVAFPRQAQFHPLRYLNALALAVQAKGGKIFTHTEVKSVEGGRPARVTTDRGFQVVSAAVVVAANVPFNDRVTMHTKMAAYRTYCVGLRVPSRKSPALGLYWDNSDPYHYVRWAKDPEGEILIVGGEDHRTGQDGEAVDHYEKLRRWAAERLGVHAPIAYSWSGQVMEPHDGLAFIGRNPHDEENVFIVTGDSGHGLTHGTIAGILLTDLIKGKPNPWAKLYDPSRVSLLSLNTFVKETMQSTVPYSDWIDGGDVSSPQDIPKCEGAVIREGLQKIAVYKDSFGRIHRYSAVCPHLNGIVRWNSAEKTWDCPCHGSRFDKMGNVINGPATIGLLEIADSSIQEGESASA
ncbi:MAG: FAD-dependent oxidoreductase [Bacteriovoracia bacterium]